MVLKPPTDRDGCGQFPGNWVNSSLVIRKSGVNALRFHVKLCNSKLRHLQAIGDRRFPSDPVRVLNRTSPDNGGDRGSFPEITDRLQKKGVLN